MSHYPDVPVELIWAAACQALSTNKGYIKDDEVKEGEQSNRELFEFYVFNTDKITDQAILDGVEIRDYLQGMLFKLISDDRMVLYNKKLIKLAGEDEIKLDRFNVATIASAPHFVIREQLKDEYFRTIGNCEREYVGIVDQKVQLNLKILKAHYSKQWERHYVTAITTDNKLVFFSTASKRLINVGSTVSVTAKVKRHYIDQYTDHETTQLNYVTTGLE